MEHIEFPEKLKGRYQAFTQADLTNLRKAGYSAPFKTVAWCCSLYAMVKIRISNRGL